MPSKYEAAFQAAVIDRERQICIDLLRETPELTLGEIHKISKGSLGRIFDAISVAELIAGAASDAPAKPRGRVGRPRGSKSAKAPAQQSLVADEAPSEVGDAAPSAPKKVNTRTPAGRAAYDKAIFAALTGIVLYTKKDFSWMRGALAIMGLAAAGLIVASIVFGFSLGIIFTVAMIAFAACYTLSDSSNILHRYRTDPYVAASLGLFASVALLFWYVIRLFMALRD